MLSWNIPSRKQTNLCCIPKNFETRTFGIKFLLRVCVQDGTHNNFLAGNIQGSKGKRCEIFFKFYAKFFDDTFVINLIEFHLTN